MKIKIIAKNIKKYSAHNNDDTVKFYMLYEYNEMGLVEKENYYSPDEKLTNFTAYSYYNDGSVRNITEYDKDGNFVSEDYFEQATTN